MCHTLPPYENYVPMCSCLITHVLHHMTTHYIMAHNATVMEQASTQLKMIYILHPFYMHSSHIGVV